MRVKWCLWERTATTRHSAGHQNSGTPPRRDPGRSRRDGVPAPGQTSNLPTTGKQGSRSPPRPSTPPNWVRRVGMRLSSPLRARHVLADAELRWSLREGRRSSPWSRTSSFATVTGAMSRRSSTCRLTASSRHQMEPTRCVVGSQLSGGGPWTLATKKGWPTYVLDTSRCKRSRSAPRSAKASGRTGGQSRVNPRRAVDGLSDAERHSG